MTRRAKIVATIGPATSDPDSLQRLMEAGMDFCRLNFSHGSHADHALVMDRVKELRQAHGNPLGILQDLQGPKIRTGVLFNGEPVKLLEGQDFTLTTDVIEGTSSRVSVNYPALPDDVQVGDHIMLDDGQLELEVRSLTGSEVETRVIQGGTLGSRKGLNLPGVELSTPSLTEKDLEHLEFGLEHGVDAVALSFVRRADDVLQLRRAIEKNSQDGIKPLVIAKLERSQAVVNLDEILDVVDGVMVARGDLGVEVGPERVPSLQKTIIQQAIARQRFVITATQMLESMIENRRPTRAEASDVANAVFDGSDALMLSGETAIGQHPVAAIQTMSRIILDAEEHALEWTRDFSNPQAVTSDDALATTLAARELAGDRDVAAIAVFTRSGRTAWLMANARPTVPTLAFTPEPQTYTKLSLAWGVIPHLIPMAHTVEEMIERVRSACRESGLVQPGEQVVMVASLPVGEMGPPNFVLLLAV
jgi:pyruvate kinase